MARIFPFSALRPASGLASKICELPYDVMSSEEAREMAKENPLSFLHVSKPEIDLDPETPLYADQVYAKGFENFQRLIRDGALIREKKPRFYLYRQVMGKHRQTGIVAVAHCEDYEKNIIKKHEFTRPDKEDDRVRHIETLRAQTGPVFLTYRPNPQIDMFVESRMMDEPCEDFIAADGIRHSAWDIPSVSDMEMLQKIFETIPSLYVADGHHRSAAAVRVWRSRKFQGSTSDSFLSVLFPSNQMQILSYNRVVQDWNGLTPDDLISKLKTLGHLVSTVEPVPSKKHQICILHKGGWLSFTWNSSLVEKENATGQLDVSLLQKHILAPMLGIDDPRTSARIQFIGGIRGTAALEDKIFKDNWAVAFSMFPTQMDDLMKIADQGGIMPPKSTWFEPKLRDAMFCHMLDD